MKFCVTCHEWKRPEDFNVRRAARDGRQARCRDCCRAWYRANAQQQKAYVYRRNKGERAVLRRRITDYLLAHPCVDCGEADVRCLEFDHRPGEIKTANIARLMGLPTTWELIEREIAKCEVRCANCHRRRTSERASWWRQGVQEQSTREAAAAAAARLAALGLPRAV